MISLIRKATLACMAQNSKVFLKAIVKANGELYQNEPVKTNCKARSQEIG